MKKIAVFLLSFLVLRCQAGVFDETFFNFGTASSSPGITVNRARGHSAAPELIQVGDTLSGFYVGGFNGSAFTAQKAGFKIQATETWSTTANGSKFTVQVTSNTTTTLVDAFVVTGASVSVGVPLFTFAANAAPRTTLTPTSVGQVVYNSTARELCLSSGTVINSWVQVSSPTAACQN